MSISPVTRLASTSPYWLPTVIFSACTSSTVTSPELLLASKVFDRQLWAETSP